MATSIIEEMLPMLPFSRFSKRLTIITVGAIVITGLITYYVVYYSPLNNNQKPNNQLETKVIKQDSKIKITANTDIVQKIIYEKCNDEEILRTKPDNNLIGLNIYQMQNIYSGWKIEKFDDLEVVMSLKVDSYCREHANNIFLGIKDGHVTIFYGKPGPKAVVKEITQIPVNKLMSQDVEELRRGMVINSKEELLQTLEGMQSK